MSSKCYETKLQQRLECRVAILLGDGEKTQWCKEEILHNINYYQVSCPECGKKKAIMEYFYKYIGIRCP